ncbi:MAG TPA: nucleotidyltransferase domain-containing protein [Spirochaetia bacterium]|nr:nucleotidyltransferase domain-containing protein [Spirochaetia bacterium]
MQDEMKKPDLELVAQEIAARLKQLPISRVILFGSSASGTAEADSDVDIAVVVNEPRAFESYDQRLEAKSRIRRELLDINRGLPIDILLYTEAEYEDFRKHDGFLQMEVVEKGRTLYEAAGRELA